METQRARRSIGWNSYCNDAIRISTVFLAVPHCSGGIDIQKRYQTRSEAEEGHKRMCEFLEVCLAQGLLTS
jgi:hypothetical protein